MKKALLVGAATLLALTGIAVPALAGGPVVPKGRPPAADGSATAPPPSASPFVAYLYAGTYMHTSSDGAWGYFTVPQPVLDPTDHHSLVELAVQSDDEIQIVEVGITVDLGLYGDTAPRLFVYHWVDGQPTCYNGCGFVYVDAPIWPGTALVPGATHQLSIHHFRGNWWIGIDNTWMGYYPDSEWGGRYTRAGLVQWFGEVAAGSTRPCTDMGNARYASDAAAASISAMGLWSGPPVRLRTIQTHPAYYTVTVAGRNAMRYGGPGAC